MNTAGSKVCLNMIVKNEAAVIRRCLDSVRSIIDYWVIVDTGSTDGTQDIIREHLQYLPGELHERPWRDFAHNRSEALDLARDKCEYTLIIDADDALEVGRRGLPRLTADAYMVDIIDRGIIYQRTQLVRSALSWRYQGVLHEYITCDDGGPAGQLPGIRMRRNHDGARRNDPQTYRRDVAVLEAALETESDEFLRSRYRYYLAQSYRDCGEREKALEHYLARAELGFWQEEVFMSLYSAAQIKEGLGHPEQEVIDAYLRASLALSTRAEALHRASRYCRQKKRFNEGYELARRGLEIPLPTDGLFVEPSVYETGLLDEFSVNAYWAGHNQDCIDACLKILAKGKLPAAEMARVVSNAQFASERLAREPDLGAPGGRNFAEQHGLVPPRQLHSAMTGSPRVLIAILANQKEEFLPLYLKCIEALDYPKSSIVLHVRTNNNTDGTEGLLRSWLDRVGDLYADVEFDSSDLDVRVEQFAAPERNAARFAVPGQSRDISLRRAIERKCDFYFVSEVDNFIIPSTLHELVSLNLPIVAPLLRSIDVESAYSNYHAEIDSNGYYKDCDQYLWILNRWVSGIQEVPVVHCTYLIRADVLGNLSYQDGTQRHDYVVFSESARNQEIPQYLDNRQVYGHLTFAAGHKFHVANELELVSRLVDQDFETEEENAERLMADLDLNVFLSLDRGQRDNQRSSTA